MVMQQINTVCHSFLFVENKYYFVFKSQEMLATIRKETKHPNHEKFGYGAIALVIMTHGTETEVYGRDGVPVRLTDIYDLMSPYEFESMAGKPKIIIIQACAGSMSNYIILVEGVKSVFD